MGAWNRKSLKIFSRKVAFLETDHPLLENFQNFAPIGFTATQIHMLCANFVKFGWPEIGKVVRYLPDKKSKFRLNLSLWLLHASRPKYVRASSWKYSECPKFYPNRYTSGGVITGRVNIVESRHRVFPIFGEASSPSNNNDSALPASLTTVCGMVLETERCLSLAEEDGFWLIRVDG